MLHIPIACRARFCTCALGSSEEETIAESETGPTAGCYGVDVELRALDRHARGRRLVHDLVPSVEARYVGRCTAYVQSARR